jgi:hypothetical protein
MKRQSRSNTGNFGLVRPWFGTDTCLPSTSSPSSPQSLDSAVEESKKKAEPRKEKGPAVAGCELNLQRRRSRTLLDLGTLQD